MTATDGGGAGERTGGTGAEATARSPPRAGDPTSPSPLERPIRGSVAAPGRSDARVPNIILLVLDCLRAKDLAVMGASDGVRTPVLEALARSGTVFPRAVAPANWTIPSHMSFFSGTYPGVHGVRTFRRGRAPVETVAQWLKRRGYRTGLFSEMVHLGGGYGLEDGFDTVLAARAGVSDEQRTVANRLSSHAGLLYGEGVRRALEQVPPLIVPMNAFNHPQEVAYKRSVCSDRTIEEFGRWVGEGGSESPFFAYLNFVDVHEPYPHVDNGHPVGALGRWFSRTPRFYLLAVPELQRRVPWEYLRRGYRRTIASADEKIGRLLAVLERQGARDRTMIVVTGDHGQSFGEGGNVFHGCGATDSITRVPLIVSPPTGLVLPKRVERWTSLCDLPSWIKAASSGRPPFDDEGHAPFPHAIDAPDAEVVFCEGSPASDPNRSLRGVRTDLAWNHRLLAAYRGNEKWVRDLETGTIDWWEDATDPDERPPLRLTGSEAQRAFDQVFRRYFDVTPAPADAASPREIDATEEIDLAGRLRSWGYG